MARFVVLAHDWPFTHWDFLVEVGGVLRAWRLLAEPAAGIDIPAEPNGDHRLMYLDYEGPLSGGRGSVSRWDAGTCDWRADEPARVVLVLRGDALNGEAVVCETTEGWLFRFTVAG
jgi:DNA polymerase Ligase (LigD)